MRNMNGEGRSPCPLARELTGPAGAIAESESSLGSGKATRDEQCIQDLGFAFTDALYTRTGADTVSLAPLPPRQTDPQKVREVDAGAEIQVLDTVCLRILFAQARMRSEHGGDGTCSNRMTAGRVYISSCGKYSGMRGTRMTTSTVWCKCRYISLRTSRGSVSRWGAVDAIAAASGSLVVADFAMEVGTC